MKPAMSTGPLPSLDFPKPEKMPDELWRAWVESVDAMLETYNKAVAEYYGNHCHVRADVTVDGIASTQIGATFTGPMAGRVWSRPWRRRSNK